MGFQIDLLTDVFPGKSSAGALGLSTCAMIRGGQKSILFDTAAHGVIKIIERRWKELNIDPEKVEKFITKVIVRRWTVTFVFYNGVEITRAYTNGPSGNQAGWKQKKEVAAWQ